MTGRGCGCTSPRHTCGGRRSGWWPGNLRVVRAAVAGLQPVITGVVGALDAAQSNGMAGRSGAVRVGESTSTSWKYEGYLAYDKSAHLPPGASTNLRRSPDTAYPSTSGDVRVQGLGTVAGHLSALTPGGRRR